jgi:hypothetical protein
MIFVLVTTVEVTLELIFALKINGLIEANLGIGKQNDIFQYKISLP